MESIAAKHFAQDGDDAAGCDVPDQATAGPHRKRKTTRLAAASPAEVRPKYIEAGIGAGMSPATTFRCLWVRGALEGL